MSSVSTWVMGPSCPDYALDMQDDIPPELRGVSPDPVRESRTPTWVRVVALLLIVALVGYFVMVSWLMNVARTPAQAGAQARPLDAFPQ